MLFYLVGLVLAALGGDCFVRGTVGLATWLRIPAGVVGATVAAFATSSPEMTVGVLSAVDGQSQLAFGDATGSNMVNLSVVLGLTILLGAIAVDWLDIRREVLSFVAALSILVVCSVDGYIGRAEAMVIVAAFIVWLIWVIPDARRQRSDVALLGDVDHRAILIDVALGLVLLVIAGRLIVLGGKELGKRGESIRRGDSGRRHRNICSGARDDTCVGSTRAHRSRYRRGSRLEHLQLLVHSRHRRSHRPDLLRAQLHSDHSDVVSLGGSLCDSRKTTATRPSPWSSTYRSLRSIAGNDCIETIRLASSVPEESVY